MIRRDVSRSSQHAFVIELAFVGGGVCVRSSGCNGPDAHLGRNIANPTPVTSRVKSERPSSPSQTTVGQDEPRPRLTLRWMDDTQSGQSPTREQLRLLLFPDLSREEGRLRIDAAFAGAQDEERARRIERLANDPELDQELLRSLRRLSGDGRDELT